MIKYTKMFLFAHNIDTLQKMARKQTLQQIILKMPYGQGNLCVDKTIMKTDNKV